MGKKGKCVGDGNQDLLLLLLPEDFLIQILVRLPVVSLLRFKSVSKSWCSLIQASFFIDLHTTFNFSSSSSSSKQQQQQQQQQLGGDSSSSSTFILQASGVVSGGSEFLVLSCDNNNNKKNNYSDEDDDEVVLFKLDDLEHPLLRYNSSDLVRLSYIAGSCNGLICLHDLYHLKDFFLCNPATRQSKILPKPITIRDYDVFCYLVGFGFDVETKDYKVLLITYSTPKYIGGGSGHELEYLCKVEVYSLSSNSWRLLKGINSLPGVLSQERSLYHPGICLNGSYFFVGCKLSFESYYYENCLIISFDFTKEIFTTRQFPPLQFPPLQFPDHHHHVVQRCYLSCLGEKQLALFAFRDYQNYEDCDYWVLNEEHGSGKESWTKLHSFQIKTGPRELIMPRGILNNGEFALLETRSKDETKKKMQLYNLVTKEAKTDFLICEQVKTVEVYKPSLVSIIGGNGAAEAAAAATTDRVIIGGAI